MIRILATALLALSLTASGALATSFGELVYVDGLQYKKFTDLPFTGKVNEGLQLGEIRNGKNEGPWVGYYENGRLTYKGAYKNGKREGPWVGYYENGQLMYKGAYKNGRLDGPRVWYREDGTKDGNMSGTYRNNEKVSD